MYALYICYKTGPSFTRHYFKCVSHCRGTILAVGYDWVLSFECCVLCVDGTISSHIRFHCWTLYFHFSDSPISSPLAASKLFPSHKSQVPFDCAINLEDSKIKFILSFNHVSSINLRVIWVAYVVCYRMVATHKYRMRSMKTGVVREGICLNGEMCWRIMDRQRLTINEDTSPNVVNVIFASNDVTTEC